MDKYVCIVCGIAKGKAARALVETYGGPIYKLSKVL